VIEEVLIKILGQTDGIKATISELQKLGLIDKKNAEQFSITTAQFKAAQDKKKQALQEEIEKLENLKKAQKVAFSPEQITAFNSAIKTSSNNSAILKGEQEKLSTQTSFLGNQFKQLGTTLIAAFGVYQINAFAKSSFEAFSAAELSARKLNSAIGAVGGTQEQYKKLLEQSSALQKKSIFSHQEIEGAQALATQFGFTYDTVSKLIPVISDFASATGQDLYSALESVLRGVEGQARGLKVYGIETKHTGDQQKDLLQITDQLTTKFRGQAEIVAGTALGAQKQLGNEWMTMKETIGKLLAEGLLPVMKSLTNLVAPTDKTSDSIKTFAKWTGIATVALVTGYVAAKADILIKKIWTTVTEISTAAQKGFNTAFKATPWGLIVGLAAGAIAAYYAFSKSTNAATESAKKLKEVESETQAELIKETTGLSILVEQLKLSNPHSQKRKEIIAEINEQYPDFLKNINAENASTEIISKAYADYVTNLESVIEDKIILSKLEEELTKLRETSDVVEQKAIQTTIDALKDEMKYKKILKDYDQGMVDLYKKKEATQIELNTMQIDFAQKGMRLNKQGKDYDADAIKTQNEKVKLKELELKQINKEIANYKVLRKTKPLTKEEEAAIKKAVEDRKRASEELAKLSKENVNKSLEAAAAAKSEMDALKEQNILRIKALQELYEKSTGYNDKTSEDYKKFNEGQIASQKLYETESLKLTEKYENDIYLASLSKKDAEVVAIMQKYEKLLILAGDNADETKALMKQEYDELNTLQISANEKELIQLQKQEQLKFILKQTADKKLFEATKHTPQQTTEFEDKQKTEKLQFELTQEKEQRAAIFDIDKDAAQKRIDLDLTIANKEKEIQDSEIADRIAAEKAKMEAIEKTEKFASDVQDAIFEQLDKQSEYERKLNDDKISIQEHNIEQQQKLAERGLANTLSFEETKQRELEKKKLEQDRADKKRAKEQEAVKLAMAFIDVFEKDISGDKKMTTSAALMDAFKSTMLAKIMGTAIASMFEEGGIVGIDGKSIDTGILQGARHSQGGIPIVAEGGEGILSRKEINNMGIANFYNLKRMLKQPISADVSNSTNNVALLNKVNELNETFKSIPKITYDVDGLHQLIRTEMKNGYKTQTTFKKRNVNN